MSRPQTLVSGGTGFVGRFIIERLIAAGHEVAFMGRRPPPEGFFSAPVRFVQGALDPDIDQRPAFEGLGNFVHAAFDHLPGKYRGGEGADAAGFRRKNLDGSISLFEAAREAGVKRAVFLSSRAVYGAQRLIAEATAPQPDTLYGAVKLAVEEHLERMFEGGWTGASLRITGVYGPAGPGREHKWTGLFRDYLAGRPVEPRAGTEVHGADVAEVVRLILTIGEDDLRLDRFGMPTGRSAFNVSDIGVDRHDLLAIVKEVAGCPHPLPARADTSMLHAVATDKLRALGWKPGGAALLRRTVEGLAREMLRSPAA